MAGGQRRQSLTLQLSAWIGVVIVAVGIVACALSFTFAYQEAKALQDGQLSQIAALIDNSTLTFSGSRASLQSALNADVKVVISSLTEGRSRVVPDIAPAVDPALADGLHDLRSEERDCTRRGDENARSGPPSASSAHARRHGHRPREAIAAYTACSCR